MKVCSRLFLAAAILCAFTLVQAQTSVAGQKNRREILQEEQLKKLLAKAGVDVSEINARSDQPQAHREVKIRWSDSTSPPSNNETRPSISRTEQKSAPSVSVLEDKKRSGTLPRHRALQLSPTHLFIAAVSETNQLRWWSIISDPRLVRAESQAADGELRREDYYQSNFTLSVAFPDDPKITTLRFYNPVWNGSEFDLELLAVVAVR